MKRPAVCDTVLPEVTLCRPVIGIVFLAFVAVAIVAGCKTNGDLTPLQQSYLPRLSHESNGVSITLSIAQNNAMGSRLSIENNGTEPVRVSPDMITLSIRDTLFLHPVKDYHGFMYNRLQNAKKACDDSRRFQDCRQAITLYFMPFLKEKPFMFSTINPGEKREGVFAFDLLDPFNDSREAKKIARWLRARTGPLEASLSIMVKTKYAPETATFPLKAHIIQKEPEIPLGLLQFSH